MIFHIASVWSLRKYKGEKKIITKHLLNQLKPPGSVHVFLSFPSKQKQHKNINPKLLFSFFLCFVLPVGENISRFSEKMKVWGADCCERKWGEMLDWLSPPKILGAGMWLVSTNLLDSHLTTGKHHKITREARGLWDIVGCFPKYFRIAHLNWT